MVKNKKRKMDDPDGEDPNINPDGEDPNIIDQVFQSIKVPLASIARHDYDDYYIKKINSYVLTMHQIAVHCLKFLKLYYLRKYESGIIINIDKDLIENICKVVSVQDNRGGGNANAATIAMRAELNQFYNARYRYYGIVRPQSINLGTAILYFSEEVITMYENCVKQNFYKYVERYVALLMGNTLEINAIEEDENLTAQEKKARKAAFLRLYRRSVSDIFVTQHHVVEGIRVYDYASLQFVPAIQRWRHRRFLDEVKGEVLPAGPFAENNIYYDLKANPMRYFPCMVFIAKALEAVGERLGNLFPLRTSNIPGHMRIDTTTLIKILYPTRFAPGYEYVMHRTNGTKRSDATLGGYLSSNKDLLWDIFFKVQEKRQVFHGSIVLDGVHELDELDHQYENYCTAHNYTFHHQIVTDGISCTVVLVHKSKAHMKYPKNPINAPVRVEPHIHEIDEATREDIKHDNIVAIDPGKSDLLFAVGDRDQELETRLEWRYTQNQRRKETDSTFYKNSMQDEKRNNLVGGVSIEQLETHAGQGISSKVMNSDQFQQYCIQNNHFMSQVRPFYTQDIYRKRRFQKYRKRQKSEARMLESFKQKFGSPDVTIVCIGDYGQRHHMRFVEPVKGKGFRKLFKKAGYKVFLVDEFRTSTICSKCENIEATCESFRRVKNPKPRSRVAYPTTRCHGLLRCRTCNTLWNRDVLGATNIHKIASSEILGEGRPQYLQREQED